MSRDDYVLLAHLLEASAIVEQTSSLPAVLWVCCRPALDTMQRWSTTINQTTKRLLTAVLSTRSTVVVLGVVVSCDAPMLAVWCRSTKVCLSVTSPTRFRHRVPGFKVSR